MINEKQASHHFSGQGKDIFLKSDVGVLIPRSCFYRLFSRILNHNTGVKIRIVEHITNYRAFKLAVRESCLVVVRAQARQSSNATTHIPNSKNADSIHQKHTALISTSWIVTR